MMEYSNTGVCEFQIGSPSEDERKKLVEDGYTFMSKNHEIGEPDKEYEIWMR